jgi:hypothetical protein
MGNDFVVASGGTGNKLTKAIVILAGVGSLIATLISFLFVSLHTCFCTKEPD